MSELCPKHFDDPDLTDGSCLGCELDRIERERDKLREINANGALAWDLLQSQLETAKAELAEARELADHNAKVAASAVIAMNGYRNALAQNQAKKEGDL
jgi:hypothetical protein